MKALLAQVNWRPSNRDLRIFALAIACLMGMLTLIGRLRYGQMPEYGASALRAALAAVLLGLACPTSLLWPYRLWTSIATPLFLVFQTLVMARMFYLVLTPVGRFFRLIGRDPLNRRFASKQDRYWLPHSPPSDRRRYFRQY